MTLLPFSVLFFVFLCAGTLLRVVLNRRQNAFVRSHREAEPVAFAPSISLEAHQKAADYTVAKIRLDYVDLGLALVWLLAMTFGGGLNYLSALAGSVSLGAWANASIVQGVALFGLLAVIGFVYELPMSLYRIFGVEARFGFNRMTAQMFVSDTIKQAVLAVVLGVPLLAAVLWFMQSAGSLWWVWTWALFMGVSIAGMVIYPVFIAPLFNKFVPLEDEALKARVEKLLARCGFEAKGLFVMDGSKRSAHGNAYFIGLGKGKRIVFFDTLLASLTHDEIEAVLAHELGHFHHKHLWQRLVMSSGMSLVFLGVLGFLVQQGWFFASLGVYVQSSAEALVLFSLVVPVFTFPMTPVSSWLSRKHEFEADAYARTHSSAADLVSALVKLFRDNASTLTPDPVYSLFYHSHPPAAIRVAHLQGSGQ